MLLCVWPKCAVNMRPQNKVKAGLKLKVVACLHDADAQSQITNIGFEDSKFHLLACYQREVCFILFLRYLCCMSCSKTETGLKCIDNPWCKQFPVYREITVFVTMATGKTNRQFICSASSNEDRDVVDKLIIDVIW